MAKRQTSNEVETRDKPRLDWLFYLVVLAFIVVATVLLWSRISTWTVDTASNIWDFFGWGLILTGITVISLVWLVWRRKFTLLISYWNQWLACIISILATWGILALFAMGGTFGDTLIGKADWTGVLRIVGLFFISVFIAAPRTFIKATSRIISSLKQKRYNTRVMLKQVSRGKTIYPPPAVEIKKSPERFTEEAPDIEPMDDMVKPVPSNKKESPEKRQVARDVWKKYGESSKAIVVDGWRLPPIDILDESVDANFSEADNMKRASLIEEALASYGVEAKVVKINTGPTVTQFGVEPGWDRKIREIKERDREGNIRKRQEEVSKTRVKVDRITSLANDLALALASPSIRIEAPVPGQSVVGIEVPNVVSSMVSLRGVIETSTFQKIESKSRLALALGKGAGGEAGASDLARMPHLLIAGATGSGKTVCLNSTICCLLLHNTPNDVRFIMIDPKRVELTSFNSIPHLAIPVIVDTNKALEALRGLNHEMDRRYQELAQAGCRNIDSYNKKRAHEDMMPYLVLVIDELADLMMAGFDEVEHILCRLAQLARATGIHLIVATQRPSVDVVTGLIKANFPTRISFAVTSQVDSRTILDGSGAEKLLGKGDMLFMPTEAAKPKRLQGCFVSDAETERLVYFWGSQRGKEVPQLKIEQPIQTAMSLKVKETPKDPLLESAVQLAREHDNISTSFLQRRLQIGYPRAARLKDQLDEVLEQEEEETFKEDEWEDVD